MSGTPIACARPTLPIHDLVDLLITQIERATDLLGVVDGAHWRALLMANGWP